jgi:hypothetical protein
MGILTKPSNTTTSFAALAAGIGIGYFTARGFGSAQEVDPGVVASQGVSASPSRLIACSGEAFIPKVALNQHGETVLSFSLIDPNSSDSFAPPGLKVVQNMSLLDPGLQAMLVAQATEGNSFGMCKVVGQLATSEDGSPMLVASNIEWER